MKILVTFFRILGAVLVELEKNMEEDKPKLWS